MKYKDFIQAMSDSELDEYARCAGTSANYIKVHLVAPKGPRKRPGARLMAGLFTASKGAVSWGDIQDWFYPQPQGAVQQDSAA